MFIASGTRLKWVEYEVLRQATILLWRRREMGKVMLKTFVIFFSCLLVCGCKARYESSEMKEAYIRTESGKIQSLYIFENTIYIVECPKALFETDNGSQLCRHTNFPYKDLHFNDGYLPAIREYLNVNTKPEFLSNEISYIENTLVRLEKYLEESTKAAVSRIDPNDIEATRGLEHFVRSNEELIEKLRSKLAKAKLELSKSLLFEVIAGSSQHRGLLAFSSKIPIYLDSSESKIFTHPFTKIKFKNPDGN